MEILVTFQSHSVRLYWVSWFKPIYTNSSKNRWPFDFCRLKIMQAYFIISHGRELSLHDHLLWCAILLNMKAVKTNTSMKGRHNVKPRFFVSSTKPLSKLCFCNSFSGVGAHHLCTYAIVLPDGVELHWGKRVPSSIRRTRTPICICQARVSALATEKTSARWSAPESDTVQWNGSQSHIFFKWCSYFESLSVSLNVTVQSG